jgi:hypothetical protein
MVGLGRRAASNARRRAFSGWAGRDCSGLLVLSVYAREKAALKLPTRLVKFDRCLLAALCERDERESVVGGVEPADDRRLGFELLDETSDRSAVDAEPPAQCCVADLTVLEEKRQQLAPARTRRRAATRASRRS